MIEVKASIHRPGGFQLDLEQSIPAEGITALFGHSGSGKTTLLRLIAGLDHTPEARVVFNETPWQHREVFVPPEARRIGYVFQHLNLFPHLTAARNLDFATNRSHKPGGLTVNEVSEILELAPLMTKLPGELSGGEQQRVAIARALLSHPDLLLMDEPLGSIDNDARARILPYLQRLRRKLDIPVIYVSHSLEEVLYLADHVITLKEGRAVASEPVMNFAVSQEAARHRDAAAILNCEVTDTGDEYGLATLACENGQLQIAADGLAAGDRVRVKIPARDVSLTRNPHESSIINILAVSIDSIDDSGTDATVLVTLGLGAQNLLARITRKSLHTMSLSVGEALYAQIKGVALMTDYEQ